MLNIQALLKSSILVGLLIPTFAMALESDYSQPVTVESDTQTADLTQNIATFINNVVIVQGSIKINAAKVEIYRAEDGSIKELKAFGKPATYTQMMENNRQVFAQGETLSYIPQTQIITLETNASIKQENSTLKGQRIVYNVKTEKMQADGGKGKGRVTTVFIPDQLKTQINDSKKK